MKKLIILLIIMLPFSSIAQNGSTVETYRIHEDIVIPNMAITYENAIKELVSNLKKHNIPDAKWLSVATNDFRYLHVTKIDKMADMDRNTFATLSEKMGENALNELFHRINKCYDEHGGYILHLDHELSYMPDGMTQTPEGQPYRRFYYWQIKPSDVEKATALAKEIKAMYKNKGIKQHYRLYRSGFGNMKTYFMVAVAAKDAISFEQQDAETMRLMGEEGKALFEKVMQTAIHFEEVSGYIRSDLSYMPQ
ncbi:hypothetical protein [Zhouia amylolytica]|uniref:Uncharacterized protein n=1 Tax=Zhouia amylolytica AD3 TaxID=1286632 RepID=W2UQH6_9FLAO|nr:hypothetical protein [Zhouia amylolytica]ETN96405.1 hypothetical protein P278_06730 [Zhouia amylolytica AD3]MCQ0112654.1 hypothetical protein [Zhouia amylolytica]